MDFYDIYNRQYIRIYHIAMLYLKNKSDAEDAVHNVFLKFMEKKIEFKDDKHEKAWFITATKNQCKDMLKNFWYRNIEFKSINLVPQEAENYENTDSVVLQCIMKLPEKYREILYLYYYEENSVKEMSEILEKKESTLQSQLFYARKKLKELLLKEGVNYE